MPRREADIRRRSYFGKVTWSARSRNNIGALRERISWWFIKRREAVYREPSTKEGEEGSRGVGWRTECGLTGRPSPAFSSIVDQERKKERNERGEKRGREERTGPTASGS